MFDPVRKIPPHSSMRILLLQPEDSPVVGPWSRERWDLILDLGRSTPFSAEAWSREMGCPVLRADSFRRGVADVRQVREVFSMGRDRLMDEEGIDWWGLTNLDILQDILTLQTLRRVAAEISPSAELWATRSGGAAGLLAILLERLVRAFGEDGLSRAATKALHYAGLARRFSPAKIREIFLDKYDSGYQWRSRFAKRHAPCAEPVVLVPSAYGNVSRMAAAYARLLPEQQFLTVVTRQSGRQFVPPRNVQLRDLAGYAKADPPTAEITSLLAQWAKLRADMDSSPDLRVLSQAGRLDAIPGWIRNGLFARDAWREVLRLEPVCGVLCGDDSNRYTLLPVLLAARRNIPTVDFHHGALDGRYLLKDLPSHLYLAKSEMERDYLLRVCGLPAEKVVMGAPTAVSPLPSGGDLPGKPPQKTSERTSAIFFSEPYEIPEIRTEEVYRELLPPLCRLVRENGRRLIIKLHPFEGRSQRSKVIRDVVSAEDSRLVTVVDGPLTEELLSQAWFGITLESTTALNCLQSGVQCFLCGWMPLVPFQYAQQYARFGVGDVLQRVEQIADIPRRLEEFRNRPHPQAGLSSAADPSLLQRWLTTGLQDPVGARPAS